MSKIERMTVAFTEPMAAEIRAAVETGQYASASEIVREAMRLWMERQERKQQEIERLRKAWDEGIASGPGEPWNLERFLEEAHARFQVRDRDSG